MQKLAFIAITVLINQNLIYASNQNDSRSKPGIFTRLNHAWEGARGITHNRISNYNEKYDSINQHIRTNQEALGKIKNDLNQCLSKLGYTQDELDSHLKRIDSWQKLGKGVGLKIKQNPRLLRELTEDMLRKNEFRDQLHMNRKQWVEGTDEHRNAEFNRLISQKPGLSENPQEVERLRKEFDERARSEYSKKEPIIQELEREHGIIPNQGYSNNK